MLIGKLPLGAALVLLTSAAAAASFEAGKHGVLDGRIVFGSGERQLVATGFDVSVDGMPVWTGSNAWDLVSATRSQENDGTVAVVHRVRKGEREIDLLAKVTVSGEVVRVAWSMPGAKRDRRGSPRYTLLAPQYVLGRAKRLYWGFGNVITEPVKTLQYGNGESLSTRHVGADYENGLSLVQATDVYPLIFRFNRDQQVFRLESRYDATFTFVASEHGAFDAAHTFAKICGYRAGSGVANALGKLCMDSWGGPNRYSAVREGIEKLATKGVRDAFFIHHGWQNGGYDNHLPEVWPPAGNKAEFDAMMATAKRLGIGRGLHDNFIDIYTNTTVFSWDLVGRNREGKPIKAFFHKAVGEQSWFFQPRKILPFVKRNTTFMRDDFAPEAYFIDVFTSKLPSEYYDENGDFHSASETALMWGRAFDVAHRVLGKDVVTVSEAGHDWLVGHVDAGASDHFPAFRMTSWEDRKDFERVPWTDMVTHGKMIMLGGGDSDRYCQLDWTKPGDPAHHGYGTDDYFCTTLIGGRNPMSGVLCTQKTIRTYRRLHDACRDLARGEFLSFEFVDGNIHHQHSVFSTGEVWVNTYKDRPWEVNGLVLPPYGYYAKTVSAETTNADKSMLPSVPYEKSDMDRGLWRITFADGTTLDAADCSCRAKRTAEGRKYHYAATEAEVVVTEPLQNGESIFSVRSKPGYDVIKFEKNMRKQ